MPSADFGSVPGNDNLKRTLADAIRDGTLGHAYIIEGGEGIGKHALAESLAEAALCTGGGALPCGHCTSCIHAVAGSHPDIINVGREGKASLGVDAIRRVRDDAYVIPSESERKVYIIEDADTMTVEAQNAFLLSLEEPPAYVLFLLLCRDSKSLLETIRSRAPSLRMRPCRRDVTEEYLLASARKESLGLRSDGEKWDELLTIASGRPELALRILKDGSLPDRIAEKKRSLSLLTSMLSGDDGVIVDIASMKKIKRDEAQGLLDCICLALRDMLVSKKTRAFEPCFFLSVDAAVSASSAFTARKLAFAVDCARECADAIDRNGAVTTSLLSMAIKIKNS